MKTRKIITRKNIGNLLIIFILLIVGGIITQNKTSCKNPFILSVKAEEETDESAAQNEEEKEVEKVDEDNEDPFLYTTDTGQLQVQTKGDDLQADIYLIIQDKDRTERTIYISPYRDSKNEQRITAGTYTIKEIYLLDKDYEDTYEFKHNEKLIVFPDERVFFDIEVIEVGKSKQNELLKTDDQTEIEDPIEEDNEVEGDEIIIEEETKPSKSSMSNKTMLVAGGGTIIGLIIFGVLKFFGFLNKQ